MQGVCVVVSVLLSVQSANGFGWGGGGGGCGCAAPPPPPPCGGAQGPPACPPPPPCPTAICPPQPIYDKCPVCAPIPVYEVPACPPCPPPPQTICVAQQIPAPPPPPPPPAAPISAPISAPVSSCCSRSPCGQPCARKLRVLGAVIHDVAGTEQDPTCNSRTLKTILEKSISVDTETSKHAIHNETLALKGKHDVICANSDFSYIVNSNSFCQLTKDDITCYVFKQA